MKKLILLLSLVATTTMIMAVDDTSKVSYSQMSLTAESGAHYATVKAEQVFTNTSTDSTDVKAIAIAIGGSGGDSVRTNILSSILPDLGGGKVTHIMASKKDSARMPLVAKAPLSALIAA